MLFLAFFGLFLTFFGLFWIFKRVFRSYAGAVQEWVAAAYV